MTSQLPWKVGECSDDQKMILSANDKYVCSVQIWQTPRRMGYDMEKERLANASFIVRACNNHERLVDVCKKALDMSSLLAEMHDIDTSSERCEELDNHINAIGNEIKQALQSAEI